MTEQRTIGDGTDQPPVIPKRKQEDDLYFPPQCGYVNCLADAPGLLLSDSEESYTSSSPPDELTDGFSRPNMRKWTSVWDNDDSDDENDYYSPAHVQFSKAHVREYAVTIGDHPACLGSLPLTLDWAHATEKVYALEEYEIIKQLRPRCRRRRYNGRPQKLDFWQRRAVLQAVGPLVQVEEDLASGEDEESEDEADERDEAPLSFWPSCDGGENVLEMEFGFRFPVMTVQVLEAVSYTHLTLPTKA